MNRFVMASVALSAALGTAACGRQPPQEMVETDRAGDLVAESVADVTAAEAAAAAEHQPSRPVAERARPRPPA